MWCSDPFVNYLKDLGYCMVRLPKSDMKPLQILSKQGRELSRLGELSTVLTAGDVIPLPQIVENVQAASIAGKRTGDLSVGIGLNILGNVIGAMGGSMLGLDVAYKTAKTTSFEFNDVFEDRVEVAKLDQYLSDADVSPFSRYVATLLEADEIFVISSTIKSRKFSVEAKKSDGASLAVSVPVVKEIVGANVNVSGQTEVTAKVTYEGNAPLVFGLQAIRLFYDKGKYTAFEPASGAAVRGIRSPDEAVSRLKTEGAFVKIS
jgi:hypothetical protein